MSNAMRLLACVTVTSSIGLAVFWWFCGFYSIRPIGDAPGGRTVIVWRTNDEPFFNSADALCLRNTGDTSLSCRGAALVQAPSDRIVVRLPFQRWAYLQSTRSAGGGR